MTKRRVMAIVLGLCLGFGFYACNTVKTENADGSTTTTTSINTDALAATVDAISTLTALGTNAYAQISNIEAQIDAAQNSGKPTDWLETLLAAWQTYYTTTQTQRGDLEKSLATSRALKVN